MRLGAWKEVDRPLNLVGYIPRRQRVILWPECVAIVSTNKMSYSQDSPDSLSAGLVATLAF